MQLSTEAFVQVENEEVALGVEDRTFSLALRGEVGELRELVEPFVVRESGEQADPLRLQWLSGEPLRDPLVVPAGNVRPRLSEHDVSEFVDDDLPSSRQVLRRYRREVEPVRAVPVPFPLLRVLAASNEWYSRRTDGHLPPVFTPYKVDAMWKGHAFSNARAKAELGWSPPVPMEQALERSFGIQAAQG